MRRLLLTLLAMLCALPAALAGESAGESPQRAAVLAGITGVIGPATAMYVQNAVD